MLPDPVEMARMVELIRGRTLAALPGATVRDVPGGRIMCHPPTAHEELPSNNRNRILWMSLAVSEADVRAAVAAAAEMGMRRYFFLVGPGAWRDGLEAELAAVGARPWPHVEYWSLIRAAGPIDDPRPTTLTFRAITPEEAPRVIGAARGWYTDQGIAAALRIIELGLAEFFAAFDKEGGVERPVALASLMVGGEWSYLGFAGTAETHRGRGGQTGLIRARVRRAAERGARWCVSETNTAVPTSLRNLKRCGFVERYLTRVFVVDGA